VQRIIESSLGAALAVAQHVPPKEGAALAALARHAFVSGMDLGLVIAASVVAVAAVIVVALLPNQGSHPPAEPGPRSDELGPSALPTGGPAPYG
jgi:DHA2 family multidrug resistance protein-like MFS transporter